MRTSKIIICYVFVSFCFFMVACSNLVQRNTIDLTVTSFSTIESSPTVAAETNENVDNLMPSTKVVTQTPNPTKTSLPQPTIVSIPTPVPPIMNRYPSLEELETYLSDLDLYIEPNLYGHEVETIYEDVNGDGEDDLIISDYMFIGVFLWLGDRYEGALIYQGDPWKYDPGSRIILEDWTKDGVPEIVFDYRQDTGGTGFRMTSWYRYIIRCMNDFSCRVIWSGQIEELTESVGNGGIAILQTNLEPNQEINDVSSFQMVSESFAIYAPVTLPFSYIPNDGLLSYESGRELEDYSDFSLEGTFKSYTSTVDIFVWNGNEFEWQDTKLLSPATISDSQAMLEARSEDGPDAIVTYKFNNDAGMENDICQLSVDDQKVGLEFGCKHDFTQIEWEDVTKDGEDELLILAYSGVYLDSGFEGKPDFPDKDCMHQRMIIYQWVNAELKEIADVTGCVVASDLYGVRLEDVDGDGQVEILAADGLFTDSRCSSRFSTAGIEGKQENCWYNLGYQNEVYRWNGSVFMYSGLLNE